MHITRVAKYLVSPSSLLRIDRIAAASFLAPSTHPPPQWGPYLFLTAKKSFTHFFSRVLSLPASRFLPNFSRPAFSGFMTCHRSTHCSEIYCFSCPFSLISFTTSQPFSSDKCRGGGWGRLVLPPYALRPQRSHASGWGGEGCSLFSGFLPRVANPCSFEKNPLPFTGAIAATHLAHPPVPTQPPPPIHPFKNPTSTYSTRLSFFWC